jgi:hypothetical protein
MQAQGKVAGNVSLESAYTSYDETSSIWTKEEYNQFVSDQELSTDLYNYDRYARASVVPGLRERLNLSLFYFKPTYKIALYARVTNSDWVTPNELRYVDRLSLTASFSAVQITAGDAYLNSIEYFIANRQLRGVSGHADFFKETPGYDVKIKAFSGITEYKTDIGDPVTTRYQSYYTINKFQRNFSGGEIITKLFDELLVFNMGYLTGGDAAEGNIDSLASRPLENTVSGGRAQINLIKNQVYLYGDVYSSTKDSVFTTHTNSGSAKVATRFGAGIKSDQIELKFSTYNIDPDYYTFGQPYLINDRNGFQAKGSISFSKKLNLTTLIDFYKTNTKENEDLATISSKQIDLRAGLPINEKLSISANYFRLSDAGNGSEGSETDIFRLSNTLDAGASYTALTWQLSLTFGTSSTTDNSTYGFTEEQDGSKTAIRGINSSRLFYGLSGYYNFSNNLTTNFSINANSLEQEGIDETTITTFLFNSSYAMPEQKLKFILFGQYNYSNNDLKNGQFFQDIAAATESRYKLYSAINKFTHNYVDFSAEYLFSYSLRLKGGVRYESKDYRYLEDQFLNANDLQQEMLILGNPNFFNQKESYSALVFTLGINYLL